MRCGVEFMKAMSSVSESHIFQTLTESQIYRDYREAFESSTGLPLSLHRPDDDHECGSPEKQTIGSPFCALMARTNRACEACYALQKKLETEAQLEPKTLKCFAGLCETAVPVRVGEELIAFLQTGRILVEKPNQRQFGKIARELLRLGTHIDLKQAEEAYYASRVISVGQYQSMIKLLSIFADHLASCGGQLALQRSGSENTAVTHARQIIDNTFQEDLSLGDVAKFVNISASYFSEQFKKATGLNFVEYVSRLRVEKAKNLLQNPKFRISDVAFDVGFQSLSQFNRTFRRITGKSPRVYRSSLNEVVKKAS